MNGPDDDYDDRPDDDDDELDDADSCGSTRDGQCDFAGTEWCDFSCPMHDAVFAKAIRRTKRKR